MRCVYIHAGFVNCLQSQLLFQRCIRCFVTCYIIAQFAQFCNGKVFLYFFKGVQRGFLAVVCYYYWILSVGVSWALHTLPYKDKK